MARLLGDEMRLLDHESLRVVCLNTKHMVLAVEEVTRGTLNESLFHPREAFRPALARQAHAVIFVHNHPSGNPQPSDADLQVTRRMREAGESAGGAGARPCDSRRAARGRPARFFQLQGRGAAVIHATAIVDPSAQLGAEVKVGPYAIVEAGCVIGEGCEIRAHAVICAGTVMGAHNQVGYGAVIGGEPQDYGFKGGPSRVEIGARNKIREYVTIHRATQSGGATRVGDDNFLMGGVHLGHDVEVGNGAVLANNTLLSGYVQVGRPGVFGRGDAGASVCPGRRARHHAGRDAAGQGCAALFHGGWRRTR